MQVLADKLRQELAGADLARTMHDLTTLYAYTEEEIIESTVLMNLVKDKLLKEIRDKSLYFSRFKRYIWKLFCCGWNGGGKRNP